MTPSNVALRLPFVPVLHAGPPFKPPGAGAAQPPLPSPPPGSSTEFLPLLLARFPGAGASPIESPSLKQPANASTPPTTLATVLQLNGNLQTAMTQANAVGTVLASPNGTTSIQSPATETKTALKKQLDTTSTPIPIAPTLDAPQSPQELQARQALVAVRGSAPEAGSRTLIENDVPSSKPSGTSPTVETPFGPDHPIQTADVAAKVKPDDIDDFNSQGSTNSLKAIALPRLKVPVESLAMDTKPSGKLAGDEPRSNSAVDKVADTDGDEASSAPAESNRLTNEPSNGPIVRHDEAGPTPMSEQVADTFRTHLDQLQQQGRIEVRMDLHPPDLGRMQLHLTMQDNHLSVRMVVQNDSAKHVLEQQLEPLRIRFSEMGVNLGQLDVRRDGNAPNQQAGSDAERSSTSAQTGRSTANRLRSSYGQATNPRGLVDVIA